MPKAMPVVNHKKKRQGSQSGFTLIEVLVAMIVLGIGVVGMASLQAVGVKESMDTIMRTQADILINDLVERMRINRAAAIEGEASVYESAGEEISNPPPCASKTAACTPADIANYDLSQWQLAMQNSKLPSATGTVARTADVDNEFTIMLFWDEARNGATGKGCDPNATSDMACVRMVIQL